MKEQIALTAKLGPRAHKLRLGHEQLYELESGMPWHDDAFLRKVNAQFASFSKADPRGPVPKIFARLRTGDWMQADVTETIRLALIGGGASPEEAREIVRDHVLDKPLAGSVQLAIAALGATLVGKKEQAAA